ncbi:starvation-inducible outer membrane lipoprotein [Sphingopyxis panaciterrae]|uniref:hypothetical protein n=1 Tax=Sphingopyxis panaciterrae TaxID=363841 RepID=UPI00141E3C83|nr:hypothetical protein [Sphingopyxis panaciterrae]NIJ37920.1 starvation-inducible outer membrane lipoprotein [Sphingopyxis panaciterrae]
MRLTVAIAALALTGCAASPAGLGKDEIDMTLVSPKKPDVVAGCIALSLQGDNPAIRADENHYVVVRKNGFGAPVIRWDIIGTDTGSRLELRSSLPVGSGSDKVKACL